MSLEVQVGYEVYIYQLQPIIALLNKIRDVKEHETEYCKARSCDRGITF